MSPRGLIFAFVLSGFVFSCAGGEEVARRRGDWTQTGRKISPLAYAWYSRGSYHERHGDLPNALHAYQSALREDPESGSAWAALGRVLCRANDPDTEKVFERGLKTAERKAPVFKERAVCRLAQAKKDTQRVLKACDDFEHAMKLEPQAVHVSSQYVSCLRRAGMPQKAGRQERAARLYFGTSIESVREPTLENVDQALLADDLEKAQDLSLVLMSPGALAARAALLGKMDLARAQAEFVLSASPTDVNASVTLLALDSKLPPSTDTLRGMSGPGLLLLSKALSRQASPTIAREFLEYHREELSNLKDPLIARALRESPAPP